MRLKNVIIIIVVLALLGLGGFYVTNKGFVFIPGITPTSTPTLVGNDKDEHGCLPSAGYSWCEAKQKCLRPFEETCISPSATPTGDDTESLKTTIKKQLVAKNGQAANSLVIAVSKIEGNYAKGSTNEQGGGGLWFAAKVNGEWKLVSDGNGIISCQVIAGYNFPTTLIPQCFDTVNQKLITR